MTPTPIPTGMWLIWDTLELGWLRSGNPTTGFRTKAGRYGFESAMKIVSDMNKNLTEEKEPRYTMVYDE